MKAFVTTAILSIGAFLLATGSADAEVEQRDEKPAFEITGLAGVQFGGEITGVGGRLNFDSAASYGGQVGARVQKDGLAIVSYQRQRSPVTVSFSDGSPPGKLDVDIGYLQVGGELELPVNPHLIPIIGLTIGATHLTPRGTGTPTEWFFSGTAFAGAKIPITKHIGLRTQIRFLGTLINSDTSFICISNGGAVCKISVRDVEGLIQGDVTAGIYIAF